MRELPITKRKTRAEDGRRLTLQYTILVEETLDGLEHYGVKITEVETATSASVANLTMNGQKIYDLVKKLADGAVTSTGLMDVLADWL